MGPFRSLFEFYLHEKVTDKKHYFQVKSNKNVEISVRCREHSALHQLQTAQSLQYYAFSNEVVDDKQAKSIIDNDYL